MKKTTSSPYTLTLIITAVLLGLSVYMLIGATSKEYPKGRSFHAPSSYLSNDTVFFAETNDELHYASNKYILSWSPMFGLPDAVNLFPFGNCTPYLCIQYAIPIVDDKDYAVTWNLSGNRLIIDKVHFLYDNKKVEKQYPQKSDYEKTIAQAGKKYWSTHAPDSIPAEVANWKEFDPVYASWYTGTLYAQRMDHIFADSVKVDGKFRRGFPVLKLKFEHGVLANSEEVWLQPIKYELPPPPADLTQ